MVWSLKDADASHVPCGEHHQGKSQEQCEAFYYCHHAFICLPCSFRLSLPPHGYISVTFRPSRRTDNSLFCFLAQLSMPLESSSFAHGYRRGLRSLTQTSRQRYVFFLDTVRMLANAPSIGNAPGSCNQRTPRSAASKIPVNLVSKRPGGALAVLLFLKISPGHVEGTRGIFFLPVRGERPVGRTDSTD